MNLNLKINSQINVGTERRTDIFLRNARVPLREEDDGVSLASQSGDPDSYPSFLANNKTLIDRARAEEQLSHVANVPERSCDDEIADMLASWNVNKPPSSLLDNTMSSTTHSGCIVNRSY